MRAKSISPGDSCVKRTARSNDWVAALRTGLVAPVPDMDRDEALSAVGALLSIIQQSIWSQDQGM
jgi:hypothetical protein